ncbi:MAG: hypothetical protein ACFCVA_08090 [Gammaproteobacteria bacterium]
MRVTQGGRWLSLVILMNLIGCAGTFDPVSQAAQGTRIEGGSPEALALAVRRYAVLQEVPSERLVQEIERAKARFRERPSRQNYQPLVSFMALPKVPLEQKAAILGLLESHGQQFLSVSQRDLHLVPETTVFDTVRQASRTQELLAAISIRDQRIAQLESRVDGLQAVRDRCRTNEASLERRLESIQSWALTLRRQLDELGRIEESIEDRRQSTPLELPKQNDQVD